MRRQGGAGVGHGRVAVWVEGVIFGRVPRPGGGLRSNPGDSRQLDLPRQIQHRLSRLTTTVQKNDLGDRTSVAQGKTMSVRVYPVYHRILDKTTEYIH